MSGEKIEEGDKVSWDWNGNQPSGTVGEVKAGEVSVTSHRGNEIKKTGDEANPAVHIERSGNDVVKTANELKVESKGKGGSAKKQKSVEPEAKKAAEEEKNPEEDKKESSEQGKEAEKEKDETESEAKSGAGEKATTAKAGDKRKNDKKTPAKKADASKTEEPEAENGKDAAEDQHADKKAKTNGNGNGNGKKAAGRPPKSNGGTKKEKKVPATGRAERKTRSQGTA